MQKPFWRMTLVLRDERGERTKRRSWIRSTNRIFVQKNVGGFWYESRGDWFSFAPVNKLVRLAYLRGVCVTHTSSAGPASAYDSQQKWEKSVSLKCGYISCKTHGIAKGCLYSACMRHAFIMYARALFNVFWTVKEKRPSTAITLGIARAIFI